MGEQGLGLDQAHSGVFTELGVLYSKYVPEKLMEHIKIFWSRMNAPKVMKACEKALLWDEAVFLLKEDEQYDSAVKTMIAHPSAFSHDLFLDCAQKVRNAEVYYKAIALCGAAAVAAEPAVTGVDTESRPFSRDASVEKTG